MPGPPVYARDVVNVGPLELLTLLAIALIVLGPQRLPDAARSVGRGLREFRGALNSTRIDYDGEELHNPPEDEDEREDENEEDDDDDEADDELPPRP